jgi:hypothetical protein
MRRQARDRAQHGAGNLLRCAVVAGSRDIPLHPCPASTRTRSCGALRALMRMARQELQDERDTNQEDRIAGGKHDLDVDAGHHALALFDSTISVNNTSVGSSSVLRGVMRRTPSHARYTMGRVPPRMNNVSPGRRNHSRNAFVRFDRNSNDRASKYPTLTE